MIYSLGLSFIFSSPGLFFDWIANKQWWMLVPRLREFRKIFYQRLSFFKAERGKDAINLRPWLITSTVNISLQITIFFKSRTNFSIKEYFFGVSFPFYSIFKSKLKNFEHLIGARLGSDRNSEPKQTESTKLNSLETFRLFLFLLSRPHCLRKSPFAPLSNSYTLKVR